MCTCFSISLFSDLLNVNTTTSGKYTVMSISIWTVAQCLGILSLQNHHSVKNQDVSEVQTLSFNLKKKKGDVSATEEARQ